jgi:tetratricopeptide (TPR) repeat protein
MNARIEKFKAMLASGQDNAFLRYSLGLEYLNIKEYLLAIEHFSQSVELNPDYSAAWKGYGKALVEAQQLDKAIEIYSQGIVIAEKKRDLQALKEMQVFLKRAQKLRHEL